jgi:hypothetical protein
MGRRRSSVKKAEPNQVLFCVRFLLLPQAVDGACAGGCVILRSVVAVADWTIPSGFVPASPFYLIGLAV